jgi:hypothetical protein
LRALPTCGASGLARTERRHADVNRPEDPRPGCRSCWSRAREHRHPRTPPSWRRLPPGTFGASSQTGRTFEANGRNDRSGAQSRAHLIQGAELAALTATVVSIMSVLAAGPKRLTEEPGDRRSPAADGHSQKHSHQLVEIEMSAGGEPVVLASCSKCDVRWSKAAGRPVALVAVLELVAAGGHQHPCGENTTAGPGRPCGSRTGPGCRLPSTPRRAHSHTEPDARVGRHMGGLLPGRLSPRGCDVSRPSWTACSPGHRQTTARARSAGRVGSRGT